MAGGKYLQQKPRKGGSKPAKKIAMPQKKAANYDNFDNFDDFVNNTSDICTLNTDGAVFFVASSYTYITVTCSKKRGIEGFFFNLVAFFDKSF